MKISNKNAPQDLLAGWIIHTSGESGLKTLADRGGVNVRLNKRQKQILICLNKKFPHCQGYEALLGELGNNPEDIFFLDDLRLKGLVDISWTDFIYPNGILSHKIPKESWITLKGRTKLRETFFSRLMLFMVGINAAFILSMIKL